MNQTGVTRATSFLAEAYENVPNEITERDGWSELDFLMYEFKKCIWFIMKGEGRLGIGVSGFEASRKTRFIKDLVYSPHIDNYRGAVSAIVHYPPEGIECSMNIVDRYEQNKPGKGKINGFDRGVTNIGTLHAMGYINDTQYNEGLEKLSEALSRRPQQGYNSQEYFCYISEGFQKERLNARKGDLRVSHKYSDSDEKALRLYNKISQAYADLVDIYDDAGVPLTIINTTEKDIGFINWIKAILNQIDYEKKSTNIDFTPDPKIIIADSAQVKKILETKNN